MTNKSGTSSDIISVPEGGGAVSGIGESFSPDLFTGTGNLSVPISVPSGRGGFQPDLKLAYSTGSPNGPFGLGWSLGIPDVTRKTSKGVPRYRDSDADASDTFVLSGAEDLVRIDRRTVDGTYIETFRPRTEGLFARIERHRPLDGDGQPTGQAGDWWEVRTKNGITSIYGTPNTSVSDQAGDAAAVSDPDNGAHVFSWRLTKTVDPFGNEIRYTYRKDQQDDGPHNYTQVYLQKIEYVDCDDAGDTEFLVAIELDWEARIDPFSSYRQGFEVRTTKRCRAIEVRLNAISDPSEALIRSFRLDYADPDTLTNRLSILAKITVEGQAGAGTQRLPPLEFSYNDFDPTGRTFEPIDGPRLPGVSLANPTLETVDLFGNGLPDLVEMNGQFIRYWRNRGDGRFGDPRLMKTGPGGLSLADEDVHFIDARGDGRADLMVSKPRLAGYFPLTFEGTWDQDSFVGFDETPTVGFGAPDVKRIDLTGDGLTDMLRSGALFECYFNAKDPDEAWKDTRRLGPAGRGDLPDVRFSDPHVRTADMTGDGLQDIVRIYAGHIDYWPNLGYGRFGERVHMDGAPRLPHDWRPEFVLVGDVDGDGLADILYVQDGSVTVWMNQSGNGFSEGYTVRGTPRVVNGDAVRLIDLKGTGTPGILWSQNAFGPARASMYFLDLTGGQKPYLLCEMNNHMGAVTRISYRPSTALYLDDQKDPKTRWKTPLPFPVQTVSTVEVIDQISGGRLTTEYDYHDGYWDGEEREFRGFARVDQRDSETFCDYEAAGLDDDRPLESVGRQDFAPPKETRRWFMLGAYRDKAGRWQMPDFRDQWWAHLNADDHPNELLGAWAYRGDTDDPQRPSQPLREKLAALDDPASRREALRALRGRTLRTETYALDGSPRQNRPFTVGESIHSFRDLSDQALGESSHGIFFAYSPATRTTNWDRGDDPHTTFEWTEDFDAYGQPQKTTAIACPRGWTRPDAVPPEPFLTTHGTTAFIEADEADQYMVDRPEETKSFEVDDDGASTLVGLKAAIDDGTAATQIQSHSIVHYDGPAFEGLPKGEIGDYGAAVRTQKLVLTDDVVDAAYPAGDGGPPAYLGEQSPAWPAEYPDDFRARIDGLAGRAGYTYDETSGHFYVETGRTKYDFQDDKPPRGLAVATLDPLGHETSIAWDAAYRLLAKRVTDPAGLTTQANYDWRHFKPSQVTGPNGNRTRFKYTPLGLVEAQAVMGKADETKGDTLTTPGTERVYDLADVEATGQPVSVRTIRRVHHVNADYSPASPDETIESAEYSDGFGRVVQTRAQAGDLEFGDAGLAESSIGPAVGQPAGGQRVRVSGWTRYNNKGKAVETFEPFFSEGFGFEDVSDAPPGQSTEIFYDARGRKVRTVRPDGAETRVVFGVPGTVETPDVSTPKDIEPTPWEQYIWDGNDNGGRTAIDAVTEGDFQDHWNTPASRTVDALGRTVEATERNGPDPQDWQTTETVFDIRGNALEVVDPLGRTAATTVYDLADRPLRSESIDSGRTTAVFDAAATPIEARDSRDSLALSNVDVLKRPTKSWGRDKAGEPVRLVERLVYGDNQTDRAAAKAANRLGKPARQYDEAGRVEFGGYDFKGNLLQKTRRPVDPQLMVAAYEAADSATNWQVDTYRVDWTIDAAAGETLADRQARLLDTTDYQTDTAFDGLDRPRKMTYPEDVDQRRQVLEPTYNKAGALQAVDLDANTYVEHVAYNARGQRTLAALGNGVMTRYAYAPESFRLTRLRTEAYTQPDPTTYTPQGTPQQDFNYSYDGVGNVVEIESSAGDQTGGKNTGIGGTDSLTRTFAYDPLYRLTEATGREFAVNPAKPWEYMPAGGNANDPTQTREYTETYAYDELGSLTQLVHTFGGGAGGWTRDYAVESTSNRLQSMESAGTTRSYSYDDAGNLLTENTARHHEWDGAGRMRSFRNQVAGSRASVFAHYTYDSGGQRVQKVVCKSSGNPVQSVYIGGVFEHHMELDDGAVVQENNVLHVADDTRRIATKRIGPELDGSSPPPVQYHLGDHLQSSNVVLDGSGSVYSREEYRPYGETSFGSYQKKRYRFTGKERDEESSLYYHGARYYMPWTARWSAPDPKGMVDGPNLYQYVSGNPVRLVDPSGTAGEALKEKTKAIDIAVDAAKKGVETSSKDAKGVANITATARQDDRFTLADIWYQLSRDQRQELMTMYERDDLGEIEIVKDVVERPGEKLGSSYLPETNQIELHPTVFRELRKNGYERLVSVAKETVSEEIHHGAIYDEKVEEITGQQISRKSAGLYKRLVSVQSNEQFLNFAKRQEIESKSFAKRMVSGESGREALQSAYRAWEKENYDDEVRKLLKYSLSKLTPQQLVDRAHTVYPRNVQKTARDAVRDAIHRASGSPGVLIH